MAWPWCPAGAAKGGDDASKPVDEEAAALEAAVEEELELEGLEDEIGDVSGQWVPNLINSL